VNIEEFYDADPRRRPSTEVELGTEWRDTLGVRYEISWIADTGELYSMREPVAPEREDPFGGLHVRTGPSAPVAGMTVAVLASIATREQLEQVLDGWEEEMDRPNSVAWLAGRLRESGVAVAGS